MRARGGDAHASAVDRRVGKDGGHHRLLAARKKFGVAGLCDAERDRKRLEGEQGGR